MQELGKFLIAGSSLDSERGKDPSMAKAWVDMGSPRPSNEVEAWGGHGFTQAFPMRWRHGVDMGSPRPSHEVEAWGGHGFTQAFPMRPPHVLEKRGAMAWRIWRGCRAPTSAFHLR